MHYECVYIRAIVAPTENKWSTKEYIVYPYNNNDPNSELGMASNNNKSLIVRFSNGVQLFSELI